MLHQNCLFQCMLPSKVFHFFLYRCSEKFSHFLHVLSGVIQTARTGSVYVTLGVTIERYFAIVHPFKCFKLKKILLPSAILFAIIYNIPKVISQMSTFLEHRPYTNENIYKVMLKKMNNLFASYKSDENTLDL